MFRNIVIIAFFLSLGVRGADHYPSHYLIVIGGEGNFGKSTTADELAKSFDINIVKRCSLDYYFQRDQYTSLISQIPAQFVCFYDVWDKGIENLFKKHVSVNLHHLFPYAVKFFNDINLSPYEVLNEGPFNCEIEFHKKIEELNRNYPVLIVDHVVYAHGRNFLDFAKSLKNTHVIYIKLFSDYPSYQRRFEQRNANVDISQHRPVKPEVYLNAVLARTKRMEEKDPYEYFAIDISNLSPTQVVDSILEKHKNILSQFIPAAKK